MGKHSHPKKKKKAEKKYSVLGVNISHLKTLAGLIIQTLPQLFSSVKEEILFPLNASLAICSFY